MENVSLLCLFAELSLTKRSVAWISFLHTSVRVELFPQRNILTKFYGKKLYDTKSEGLGTVWTYIEKHHKN
jgi:hypothetical protein